MRNTTSYSLSQLDTTQSRWIRHVPGCASLASLASSETHNSCMAMQSGAVCCIPEDTVMTQPVTQKHTAGGRNDTNRRTGRIASTSHHVCARCDRAIKGNYPYIPLPTAQRWANVWQIGTSKNRFFWQARGNSRGYRESLFSLSDFFKS
jgi:hypothetical protein